VTPHGHSFLHCQTSGMFIDTTSKPPPQT